MTRRRENSPADDIIAVLHTAFENLPWWSGPLLTSVGYCVVRWPVAWLISPEDTKTPAGAMRKMLCDLAPALALVVAFFLFFIWMVVQMKSWGSRRLLDSQSGSESIRRLTWREFEELLCEAFRREGFVVEHTGSNGPDGGIDIRLVQDKTRSIVQCKHWKRNQVGVAIVREMFGLLHSEKADSAVVVTSGTFSPDALEFAKQNHVRLIDGEELSRMIVSVQSVRSSSEHDTTQKAITDPKRIAAKPPSCPRCSSSMRQKTATKGKYAGKRFWSCSAYPKCNGIVNMEHD